MIKEKPNIKPLAEIQYNKQFFHDSDGGGEGQTMKNDSPI